MKELFKIIRTFFCLICLSLSSQAQEEGSLTIHFINTANGKPIVKGGGVYKNPFGEEYALSKLKYYISLPVLYGQNENKDKGHYLIDEGKRNSIRLTVKPGTYEKIGFLLGIDSIMHCSGAQAGDLDPLMDMFWTWNSGYVIFKLEGHSSASTADLGRIEHHIGGYKGKNNVSTHVLLELPAPLTIGQGEKQEIRIEMNLDKYWNSSVALPLKDIAVITKPGEDAVKAAQNFKNLFSVLSLP